MAGTQLIADAQRRPAFKVDPDTVVIVGLDTDDGPEHPLWDKRIHLPLDPAMQASIDDKGVIQAVRGAVEAGVTYITAGRQRIRNAREVNKRRRALGLDIVLVDIIAERMGDVERQAEISAIENEIRRDTSALEKAEEAQRRIDRGQPVARIALAFGVSVPTVQAWLKTNGLALTVKKAIEAGAVTVTAASKWADLARADQIAALELAVAESGGKRVSVKGATRTVNPDAPVRPSKKAVLAAIEAMKGTPWADGAAYVLGLTTDVPDAVAALAEMKEAAQ